MNKELDMMNHITEPELKLFIAGLEFKRIHNDNENRADDGDSMLLDAFYSIGARFGATDYEDHRNDSLDAIKQLILPSLSEPRQRINYYKNNTTYYKTIGLVGYFGGYTAYFID